MYLKRLEIAGFKSFPEKIRLDFNKGITAVVGPNGSGKSNISDAVRWVLGEQSPKTLRGAKMEDVIFSGTENRRPLGYAEASVILDNSAEDAGSAGARILPEFPEITVTRRVFRSGEGEYLINGVVCRMRDVHEMFMDTGIGREGYSIIGQGRIEEILSAGADDRRMLFEEAAGIVKYKNRRQEACVKLEREKQNLVRVCDILAELSAQLDPLRAQSEKAAEYLSLRDQLKAVRVNYFLRQAEDSSERQEKLEETIRAYEEQITGEELKQSEDAARRAELNRLQEETDMRIRELNGRKIEAVSNIERTEGEKRINEEKAGFIKADMDRLKAENERIGRLAAAKSEEIHAEEAREADLVEKFESSGDALLAMQAEYDGIIGKMGEKEENLNRRNELIIEKVGSVSEIRNRLQQLEAEYLRYEEQKEALNAERERIEGDVTRSTGARRESGELIKASGERIERIEKNLSMLAEEREALSTLIQTGYAEKAEADRNLHSAETRLKVLRDLAAQYEGYYKSVGEILKRKNADPARYGGICGAIGELVETPPEYEVAVEIALGSAVSNIVTETESEAAECIEFLKANRIGRATFLPLSSVKPRDIGDARILREPGVLGRAADMVAYEKVYENAVKNALGNAVIADTMDNAIKASKKYGYSHKIVTKDGELIQPGGVITGGHIASRGPSVFGRAREIKELSEGIGALAEKNAGIENEIKLNQEKRQATDEEINRARTALQDLMMVRNGETHKYGQISAEAEQLAERQKKLSGSDGELMERIKAANREIRAVKESLALADAELDLAKDGLREYQAAIADERGERDASLNRVAEAKIEIGAIKQGMETIRAGIGRLGNEIAAAHRESDKNIEKINAFIARREETEKKVLEAAAALEDLRDDLNEYAGLLSQSEAEKDRLKEELARLDADKSDNAGLLSRLGVEKARLDARAEQNGLDMKRLYDEMWDEYRLTLERAKEEKRLALTAAQLLREERRLKAEIQELGDVNVAALDEYKNVKTRYDFLSAQRGDIIETEEKLQGIIDELTELMENRFREQLGVISKNFGQVFTEMFGGGKAYIKIRDDSSVLDSGVEVVAQPPGKNLQVMSLLSGGERALTAITLLFGILKMKPSPFCILDEIESNLDDPNVVRFADYLNRNTEGRQFIIITHRKGAMEAAGALYGVTMQEQGVSKLVSVRLEEN